MVLLRERRGWACVHKGLENRLLVPPAELFALLFELLKNGML